jgi:hypothetical protein
MTFNKPVVFSGFLHQFKNREDIAEILLTVRFSVLGVRIMVFNVTVNNISAISSRFLN